MKKERETDKKRREKERDREKKKKIERKREREREGERQIKRERREIERDIERIERLQPQFEALDKSTYKLNFVLGKYLLYTEIKIVWALGDMLYI